jgi:hypothetical protein
MLLSSIITNTVAGATGPTGPTGAIGATGATGYANGTPRIISIDYPGDDTAANTSGNETITINGSSFQNGASVIINSQLVSVVNVVNTSTITFTSPALATGSYLLYVVNPDGGSGIAVPGIQYSGVPTWNTAAGSIGSVYERITLSNTLIATSDSNIIYTLVSGSLPSGANLNSNGVITGVTQTTNTSTTYTFTVRAKDAENQETDRQFSMTVLPDTVTWVSPNANATIITANVGESVLTTLTATSDAGSPIVYTSTNLPSGLSIVGANITGTMTSSGFKNFTVKANANTTLRTAERSFYSLGIGSTPPGQQQFTTPGTYTWTCPANVFFVSVVCVGGGAGGAVGYNYNGLPCGGGGGGALAWANEIPVTPGNTYTVVVGAAGTGYKFTPSPPNVDGSPSYFVANTITNSQVRADGGKMSIDGAGGQGGSYSINVACSGSGGGFGGAGGTTGNFSGSGGGGAGGYTANGGIGGTNGGNAGANSAGGGGGGGGTTSTGYSAGAGGGGVGIFGLGANGVGGGSGTTIAIGGTGGSGGSSGGNTPNNITGGTGGLYGGGGGGVGSVGGANDSSRGGAAGAVRIIWSGNRSNDVIRLFPSANTANL